MAPRKDITGLVVGNLRVQHQASSKRSTNGRMYAYWQCVCSCGQQVVVSARELTAGAKKSCLINGHRYQHPNRVPGAIPAARLLAPAEYRAWNLMRARCRNPNNIAFDYYGGRGIKICERWEHFENFLSDMGPKPSADHTVERNDVNRDYEPANCRWATRTEQTRNKRNSIFVDYNGERVLLLDVIERLGLNGIVVRSRLNLGWSLEEALTTPAREAASTTYQGVDRPLPEVAAACGIPVTVLRARLRKGWSVDRATTEPVHPRQPNRK